MLKKIIHKLWKTEGQSGISTPAHEVAVFILIYNELKIGFLTLNEGVWEFAYTDEFKNQNTISPLVQFPDSGKVYTSQELWPFFSYRIPGLSQPSVQKIIKKDSIDQTNEVALLKKFGEFSVYNPFKLAWSN